MADNGIGIAPEHRQRVFELFHRLSPRETEGDGLGLNIVRTIVERHGGRVWLESEPGAGCRFFVALPATAPDRQDGGSGPSDHSASAGRNP